MVTCLLCPAPATWGELCLPDLCRLWAAETRRDEPERADRMLAGSCKEGNACATHGICVAYRELATTEDATAFLGRLSAAHTERRRAEVTAAQGLEAIAHDVETTAHAAREVRR